MKQTIQCSSRADTGSFFIVGLSTAEWTT